MTQDEIAQVVGAGDGSAVSQWESGVTVPDGLRRERLTELLEGRLWPALRAIALASPGFPECCERASRWYRRASRERPPRETVGGVVAATLDELRAVDSPEALRQHFAEWDGEWAHGVAARKGLGEKRRADVRRIEDAAYGLRWLELAHGLRFDLSRSLAPQLPLALRGDDRDNVRADK